jgi:hypothetical protein
VAERERVQVEGRANPPRVKTWKPDAMTPSLLHLQRLAGNAAVSSLVAQRQDENVPTQSGGGGGGGGGTVTVGSIMLRKPATITVATTNGSVTDASAQIGTP